MIDRIRQAIDRYRRGPELRAAELATAEFRRQRDEAAGEAGKLEQALGQAAAANRLLLELMRSGLLKARCTGGCGDLRWDWSPVVELLDGRQTLRPVCAECQRARAAKAEREAREAGPLPLAEAAS